MRHRPGRPAPEVSADPAPDRWPSLPAPAADPVIIADRRPASPTPRSPEPWPARLSRPAGEPAWPADHQPTVPRLGGRSPVPTSPWPELPDDELLWQAPEPERSTDRIRRLDAEQRGA